MVSTKSEPGPFDGFERAQPDEPVFTLRSADSLAPSLVSLWCERRREAIMAADFSDERRAIELIQVTEAEEIGWAMDDWRKGIKDQAALPVVAQSYSGNVMSADELAAKVKFDAVKSACRIMHNAVAELTDIIPVIAAERDEIDLGDFQAAIGTVKSLAEIITPKRASYSHAD